MKKIFLLIICFVIICIAIFFNKYANFKVEKNEIKEYNLDYELYLNKQILGTELTTVINKAVDNNEKNNIQKDSDGYYIQNDINSINVEIKITDTDTVYKMETLYGGGMINFIQYYNNIHFECIKIDYNSKGRVCYLLFEQKNN